jgi:hypothetical protein
MMLRQAHSISWSVLKGTFCGSDALCALEQMDLPRWGMSWPCAMKRKCWSTAGATLSVPLLDLPTQGAYSRFGRAGVLT